MTTKKVAYVKGKCLNTLCYDRLPNGHCTMGENPVTCIQSKAFSKTDEIIKDLPFNYQETWGLIKSNKLKDAVNVKIGTV